MRYEKSRYTYDPKSKGPFKLSRTKIDNFLKCPRCFYLDRRYGVGQPPGFPFTLNSAVDFLLKKEFDAHRAVGTKHPLMENYGVDATPFDHTKLSQWRENFEGIRYHHQPTNFIVFGAIDDVWINSQKELHIVDYKATSKEGAISLDAEWQIGYKRQAEVYQWLFRRNDFKVSDTAYFVYVNGRKDREAFDARLEFDVHLLPYSGDDSWVEPTLVDIKKTLDNAAIPEANPDCEYCQYSRERNTVETSS
ncbi:MAG: PD-(D/E)XK nuclease family protein [Candidatus Berkelbacteria bacterium]|nr:MAG: PD-(D/E)XK nuclease family protein [Candidatus Berkelbacteria bacterium]QQG52031.1 MAG: PD-(D/E)XK nuclease family protein [Candidatus Berkelbacteria bacterium]